MSKIQIQTSLLRDNILVIRERYANYLLVKAIPLDTAVQRMPLNVSLVMDVSGSMYDLVHGTEKIQYIQEAAKHAIDMLDPDDVVSIVAFADEAGVICEAQSAHNKEAIIRGIEGLSQHDLGGGTQMHKGMELGVKEIRKTMSDERMNRGILLTDGETLGADECKQIAREHSTVGITFSCIGVGVEWNKELLTAIAETYGNGSWYYMETPQDPDEGAQAIFEREFGTLLAKAYNNVRLKMNLIKGVVVKRAQQAEPEAVELALSTDDQLAELTLGSMEKDKPRYVLLDLSLPPRSPGSYLIGQLELIYDVPAAGLRGESTGLVEVSVNYTNDKSQCYVNAEVARYVDRLTANELVKKAEKEKDEARATRLLQNAGAIATRLGDAKLATALNQAVKETQLGSVSRETQISLANVGRQTSLLSSEDE